MAYFAVKQFTKWDLVQSAVDLIISGFLTSFLFWILFMHKDIAGVKALFLSDYTSVFSIASDILILVGIVSWFLSVRAGRIPSFMRIISFGLLLFAVVDMTYYYADYNDFYFPNTIVDVMYTLSLDILAFGALWKTFRHKTAVDLSIVINKGGRTRWAFLLAYPLFAVLIPAAHLVRVHLILPDYLTFGLTILLYWASCKYIQASIEKETLLRQQNEILEKRVAEQVRDLTFFANQDTLTTLFNRRYFMAGLNDAISALKLDDLMAILLIDLDRFKTINDTFGHDVGDKVLIELACRMIEWNRYGATLARLGGDEFAVLFAGKYTREDIETFCTQIIDQCCKPIDLLGSQLYLTMSIGIALISEDARDVKTLMKYADIAMYSAKARGYNKYQVYDPILSHDFEKNVEIEAMLRQTDVDKDFMLFYQPQYSLPDKKLIGAEALIRWENREHGFIPPDVFIPVAEKIEYIFKIGKWVIQEAIRQSVAWNKRYAIPLKIGFNISPKQLSDKEFMNLLETLISPDSVNPAWLDAEITESVMIKDGDCVEDVFTLLRNLGVTVSIDDFGSGYSSLS
jgi:diguanylate cyclase (GGDEF)-like protein